MAKLLTSDQAIDQVQRLKEIHDSERVQLDTVRRYWKGRQRIPAVLPDDAPRIVRTLFRVARVNICPIIVDSLTQALFVDGFRDAKTTADNDAALWAIWQANKMDARQTGLHRTAHAYGTAYAVVMPGTPLPVIRPVSPRNLTAVYGEDPDWPMWALERAGDGMWKLFDDQAVYYVSEHTEQVPVDAYSPPATRTTWTFIEAREHNAGVVPVVRYIDEDDLDCYDEVSDEVGDESMGDVPTRGQVAPMMSLQDQIDLTTFNLLVAQHFAAFRQRWIIGWTPESETSNLRAGASQLWTFADGEDSEGGGVKVGEFGQTDLDGYLESRKESLRHAATLSQTPVHELIGELVNLSAEALAAAEAGHDRKVGERKTLFGEAHEQTLRLAGKYAGVAVPDDAEVVWRDTSARTFAATIDGLGKLAQMLQVPPRMLWERIPGVTQQDVQRWEAEAQTGNAFDQLSAILDRQSRDQNQPPAD